MRSKFLDYLVWVGVTLVLLALACVPSVIWHFVEGMIPSGGLDLGRNLAFVAYAVVQLFALGAVVAASFYLWAAVKEG